jgi:hypothetical protein
MLLTGSGDELCGPYFICPISGSGLSSACCQPFCLSSLCLLKVPMEISFLPLPLSAVCLQHPSPSAACSFSVPCFFLCVWGWGISLSRGAMLVYPRGGCGSTTYCLFAHLLVCISQVGLEPAFVVWEPSCFLTVMWCGEALYGLGVWCVGILILLGVFFLPRVAPGSQQDF